MEEDLIGTFRLRFVDGSEETEIIIGFLTNHHGDPVLLRAKDGSVYPWDNIVKMSKISNG